MSGNDCSPIPDDKIMSYIYDDVDDSDIFTLEQLNNSFTENDAKDNENIEPADTTTIQELQEKLQKVIVEKELLELRLSELYKTAKAELDRKDRRFQELEQEKNNILFRRNNARNKQLNHVSEPIKLQPEKVPLNKEFQPFDAKYKIPKKINEIKEECQGVKRTGVLLDTTDEAPQYNRYSQQNKINEQAAENCRTPSTRDEYRSRLRGKQRDLPITSSRSPSTPKSKENPKEFKRIVSRRRSTHVDDNREVNKPIRRERSKTLTEENTASSKFADRPRRLPRTPPGSPPREHSPEYCSKNPKGSFKSESRRERRQSTCAEKGHPKATLIISPKSRSLSPEIDDFARKGKLRGDNEDNRKQPKMTSENKYGQKSPTKKEEFHEKISKSNSDKDKRGRPRSTSRDRNRLKDNQCRDDHKRSSSRERHHRGRDLRNRSRSRERKSSRSYKNGWRHDRDRKSSSSEHDVVRRDRYNSHIIRPRYGGLITRGRHYLSRLRERVMRHSLERDPEALRQHRKRDDADYSDLEDLKLHLSGASDEEGAKDRKDSDREFELIKHLGVNVDEMSDEDLERLLFARIKQQEEMCSEPERRGVKLTEIEEGELEETKQHLETDTSWTQQYWHSKYSDKLSSKSPEEEFSCRNKIIEKGSRSKSNKPAQSKPKQYLTKDNVEDTDKAPMKSNSSYESIIEKVQEVKQEQLNFQLKHTEIPVKRSSIEAAKPVEVAMEAQQLKIIEKGSRSKSNKPAQSEPKQYLTKDNVEDTDKAPIKSNSSYESIIEKVQEVKQEQLNFQLKHTEIPVKRSSIEAAKPVEVAMEAQETQCKPRQDSSSEAIRDNCFAEKKSPLKEKKPKKKIGLDTYKQRVRVEPVAAQAKKTADNTDDQPNEEPPNALNEDIGTRENHQASDAAVSNAKQKPTASDLKSNAVVVEIPKSDYFVLDTKIAAEHEPMERGTPCKDANSFIHDFSMSEDEDCFPVAAAPSVVEDSPKSKAEGKINILDVTILKPREPQPQHQLQDSAECIEQIQEAVRTTSDEIVKPLTNSSKNNSSTIVELQKLLEDDMNDSKKESPKLSVAPKKNDKKKKETKNKSKKQQEETALSKERMLELFGSPASSYCGSPSPKAPDQSKANSKQQKKATINNKPKKKTARSKSMDVSLLRSNEDFEETQNKKLSKSVTEKSPINCPVFFNHPSYIPNPQINQAFDTASEYISKKKDEYNKNLHKPKKAHEKPKQKKVTKKIDKEHIDKKKPSFKIKFMSMAAKKRKALNDSIEKNTGKKKKLCGCTKDVTAEDCLECMTLDSEDSTFEETISESREEDLKIKALLQKEINRITKPEHKRKRKAECTKKLKDVDDKKPGEVNSVEAESHQRKGVRARKQTSFYNDQSIESPKRKVPRRITPIKIGEIGEVSCSPQTPTATSEGKLQKLDDPEGGYKTMQSPLPHMEEMLKNFVERSNENSSVPVIPEINLDTKDVDELGSFERDILENMSAYLGDKSLPSLHSDGKTNESQKSLKEGVNQLNFSYFLNKNTNTSTPIKKCEPSESSNTLMTQSHGVSNLTNDNTSVNFAKSYLLAPLKRDRRKRVIVTMVEIT